MIDITAGKRGLLNPFRCACVLTISIALIESPCPHRYGCLGKDNSDKCDDQKTAQHGHAIFVCHIMHHLVSHLLFQVPPRDRVSNSCTESKSFPTFASKYTVT